MAGLTICTWLWGEKYGPHYVERLAASVARNLKQPHRFMVCNPLPEDRYLTEMKGCFARLRMFDPSWQAANGIDPGDRIVCMDLDLIVTGSLDGLFVRPDPFTILQNVNTSNPCEFNGSLWALDAGYRPDIWNEFSLDLASKIAFHSFPDDQGWLWDMIPEAAAFGADDGVYAFQKKHWPKGEALPANACIVAFPGHRDPAKYTHLQWVKDNWKV